MIQTVEPIHRNGGTWNQRIGHFIPIIVTYLVYILSPHDSNSKLRDPIGTCSTCHMLRNPNHHSQGFIKSCHVDHIKKILYTVQYDEDKYRDVYQGVKLVSFTVTGMIPKCRGTLGRGQGVGGPWTCGGPFLVRVEFRKRHENGETERLRRGSG